MSYEKLRGKLASGQRGNKSPPLSTPRTPPPSARGRSGGLTTMGIGGIARFVGGVGRRALTLVGAAALVSAALDYKWEREMEESRRRAAAASASADRQDDGSKDGKKKKVLVLPFHRLKVVERKEGLGGFLGSLSDWELPGVDSNKKMEIEVKDLVDTIHAAAADPDIVGLYGIFGHGSGFECGGVAHVEEIRNAIRVFNESHRVHRDPNVNHDALVLPRSREAKTSYAFADTFARNSSARGNIDYYLASEFTHVQMQSQGQLNLFGPGMITPFLRSALDKYGIKAHVFKHGKYKNAPNSATEKGYTKEHRENAESIIKSMDDTICAGIVRSRSLPDTFNRRMWDAIYNYGTLTGPNGKEIGLIDYLPRIDPLDSLLDANKSDDSLKEAKDKWGNEIDVSGFRATKRVSLREYAATVAKRKKAEMRQWSRYGTMKHLAEKSGATELLLSLFQYKSPNYNIPMDQFVKSKRMHTKEKIAVIPILGSINDSQAQKVTTALRKIKKETDIKCVILRVDSPGGSVTASEAIFQECKDLPQPVICSMSNCAASGGYYVSAHCDRIFALPTTLTGSIGVFGVKLDVTGLASDYGVNVDHIRSGEFSLPDSPFQSLSPKVKANYNRNVDRFYAYFKEIVSSGRGLSLDGVEARAQGRVWTGDQAREQELVDELGGMNRAISYAKRKCTSTGEAEVEVWPKRSGLKDALSKWMDSDAQGKGLALALSEIVVDSSTTNVESRTMNGSDLLCLLLGKGLAPFAGDGLSPLAPLMDPSSVGTPRVMLTMDEAAAIKCALQDSLLRSSHIPPPPSFWV